MLSLSVTQPWDRHSHRDAMVQHGDNLNKMNKPEEAPVPAAFTIFNTSESGRSCDRWLCDPYSSI